jgi:hypothetical protein
MISKRSKKSMKKGKCRAARRHIILGAVQPPLHPWPEEKKAHVTSLQTDQYLPWYVQNTERQ